MSMPSVSAVSSALGSRPNVSLKTKNRLGHAPLPLPQPSGRHVQSPQMIEDLASNPETGIDGKGNATVWRVGTRRCQKADESSLEQIVEFMYPILRQSVVNLTRNPPRQGAIGDNQLVWLLGSAGGILADSRFVPH